MSWVLGKATLIIRLYIPDQITLSLLTSLPRDSQKLSLVVSVEVWDIAGDLLIYSNLEVNFCETFSE
jgi:hypothetical protein